jgi:hypothetical protein
MITLRELLHACALSVCLYVVLCAALFLMVNR